MSLQQDQINELTDMFHRYLCEHSDELEVEVVQLQISRLGKSPRKLRKPFGLQVYPDLDMISRIPCDKDGSLGFVVTKQNEQGK